LNKLYFKTTKRTINNNDLYDTIYLFYAIKLLIRTKIIIAPVIKYHGDVIGDVTWLMTHVKVIHNKIVNNRKSGLKHMLLTVDFSKR